METLMLDETSLRKPTFRGGYTCTLADGQGWVFARPLRLWAPDDCEDGVTASWNVGPQFEDLRAAVVAAHRINELKPIVRAELDAYIYLLVRNYDLTVAQLRQILQLDFENDDTIEGQLRNQLLEILMGNAPSPQ